MRAKAAICGAWLLLSAFQAPDPWLLSYDFADDAIDDQLAASSTRPPEPGEQYPPRLADEAARPQPAPAAPRRRRPAADWRLSVDASVVADSNVTNSTDRETVDLNLGDVVLPVPLDPELRAHGGVGVALSASLRGRVPVAPGVAAAVDAEGYVLEQQGRLSDDSSLLVAAGAELSGGGSTLVVQAIGFERRFAGVSAMRGVGLRGRYQQRVGEGQRLSLLVDARFFDSGYGDAFGGTEAGAYLNYDIALDPTLSASAGFYARASWLGDDAYSNREFGAFGGLSHYLTDDLTGGFSAGISRVAFDGPIALLSPDPRRDWRWYGSAYLTTRRPLLIGLTPSLTYTYNRTGSSIEFYRAERHRLRFGLSRTF